MKNIATVQSAALTGFHGTVVEVETALHAGLPTLQIVGMGNKAIDEARQRVRTAITASQLSFPTTKVTVNLAPAELPKDGTHLDLPIALSILVASGQLLQKEVDHCLFAGELALDGHLRPVRGALIIAETAKNSGVRRIFLPEENVAQAQLIDTIEIIGVRHLQELFKHLKGVYPLSSIAATSSLLSTAVEAPRLIDSIVGLENAKRALAIAAAGRHNLLLSGPPGSGKSLLAKTLISLLPPLSSSEKLEVTKLHSLSNNITEIHHQPPLRAPHHNVTLTAFIGGGIRPRPGDISLAHKGVLLLDEFPEYPRATLEALRQPLEDRYITLSRLYGAITYPADILLVATMNPCPCGYLGDGYKVCSCSSAQISAYQRKISGPLLDRIDIRLVVPATPHEHFFNTKLMKQKQHLEVLNLVLNAREMQKKRYNRSDYYNAYASFEQVKEAFCATKEAKKFLMEASRKLQLSHRANLRVLRVARTIADLAQSSNLKEEHVAEALQFR